MRQTTLITHMLLLGTLVSVSLEAGDVHQQAGRLAVQVPVMLDYLLYLPPGYEEQESWPLLLFLHGGGERGDDLELVKFHGPPKLIGQGHPFPFVVVSPQCSKDRLWEPIELTALLDEIEDKYHIDEDRIYVTGLSLGGFGAWELAAYTPVRFAAIVPICGGGETYWMKRITHVPTWVFHGGKDTGVPLRRSQDMVAALRKNGGNVRLTVAPETAHLVWISAYNNPELYGWLLQQKRQPVSGD